jgi:hypothetical protein
MSFSFSNFQPENQAIFPSLNAGGRKGSGKLAIPTGHAMLIKTICGGH